MRATESKAGTATFLKTIRDAHGVYQKLYRLDPPLDGHATVVVSAADHYVGGIHVHETYIFPGNEDEGITGWSELTGSYSGGTSHENALANAGYQVKS